MMSGMLCLIRTCDLSQATQSAFPRFPHGLIVCTSTQRLRVNEAARFCNGFPSFIKESRKQ